MAYEEVTALLGGWEGFELVGVTRTAASETHPLEAAEIDAQTNRSRTHGAY